MLLVDIFMDLLDKIYWQEKAFEGENNMGILFVKMFSHPDNFMMKFKLNKKNFCSIRFVIII